MPAQPLAPWIRLLAILAMLAGLAASALAQTPGMRAAPPADDLGRAAPTRMSAQAARDATPALPLPFVTEDGRIVVRAEAGLEGLAVRVAARADEELRAIATDLRGLPVPDVVEIRLVHDAADLGRAAPPGRGAPAWAAGVAYPDVGVVVVATYRGPSSIDVGGTVDHELAHLALGAALGAAAPRWLHEGFAWLHSSDWSFDRTQTLTNMAWFGSVISLDDLQHGFPMEEAPASRAYAQSYDFVGFLARRGRWPEATDDGDRYPFQVFLAQLAATGDLDQAAQRAYGRPMSLLFEEWEADLEARYMFLPVGIALGLLWLFAVVLLVLGWRRRRRQNRVRLAEWDRREADAAARFAEQARAERGDGPPPIPRLVPVVPVWSGPSWAPPGARVSEPADEDVDLDAVLEDDGDDDDDRPRRRRVPPPRPLN